MRERPRQYAAYQRAANCAGRRTVSIPVGPITAMFAALSRPLVLMC